MLFRSLSNYEFFQFWRNIDDSQVSKFLYLFTKLSITEIKKLSKLKDKEINEAKQILAFEVTKIVRGEKNAVEALEIANNTFKSNLIDNRLDNISIKLEQIKSSEFNILDAIEKLKLVKSRSETKRLIKSNAIKVNDETYDKNDFSLMQYSSLKEIKISVGKKKFGLIKII